MAEATKAGARDGVALLGRFQNELAGATARALVAEQVIVERDQEIADLRRDVAVAQGAADSLREDVAELRADLAASDIAGVETVVPAPSAVELPPFTD